MAKNTNYCGLSIRLKDSIAKAGLVSTVSNIGVQTSPLAKHLGVSVQTIRKYLTGQAYPNFDKIILIAKFLQVSPAWLAFGEQEQYNGIAKTHNFEIKKTFLQEIIIGLFKDILNLKVDKNLLDSICDFLYGIINDIVQLELKDDLKLKLIKTAIASASVMGKAKWKKLVKTK